MRRERRNTSDSAQPVPVRLALTTYVNATLITFITLAAWPPASRDEIYNSVASPSQYFPSETSASCPWMILP